MNFETSTVKLRLKQVTDVIAQYRCAKNEINNITEALNSDKRTGKKWCESVFKSVNAVKKYLDFFKDILLQSDAAYHVQKAEQQARPMYADASKLHVNRTKHVVLISPQNPDSNEDSEKTFHFSEP
jgi:DNA-binding FrmR family transcriptional regulator